VENKIALVHTNSVVHIFTDENTYVSLIYFLHEKKIVFLHSYANILHLLVWKVKRHGMQTPTSLLAHAVRPTDLQFFPVHRRLLFPGILITKRSVSSNLTESDTLLQL
jgi:hypothetical protein